MSMNTRAQMQYGHLNSAGASLMQSQYHHQPQLPIIAVALEASQPAQVGTQAQGQSPEAVAYPTALAQQQLGYQHLQQQHQHQLQMFWQGQMREIEQAANEFKNHQLPLARIKRIVKADEDVRMISVESPVLFAKACEMSILELTLRSWIHTEENKRRTLQKNDITAAITRTDIFDFLVDVVPQDELSKEDGLAAATAGMIPRGIMPVANPPVVYYLHQQPLAGLQQEAPAATILSQQQQQQEEEANMTLSSALLLARPTEMVMDPTLDQQQQQPFVIPQKPMQQMWQQHMLPNSLNWACNSVDTLNPKP